MDAEEIARAAIDSELATPAFLRGVVTKRWEIVRYVYPELFLQMSSTNPDGSRGLFAFRFLLDGFPNKAPDVRCWDMGTNSVLPPDRRPKSPTRTSEAFKEWGYGIYRPWDRNGASHNNWATVHPNLAWHSARRLTFILEDLHDLLNSYSRKTIPQGQAAVAL